MRIPLILSRVSIIFLPVFSFGQVKNEQPNQILETITENNAELINEKGEDEIPPELSDLASHPLDLNKDDIEPLIRFNLLDPMQAEALAEYKRNMGNLIELEELQQVNGFDKRTILSILPYCSVKSEKNIPKTNQFTIRIQKNLNDNTKYYPGSNSKVLAKLKISPSPSISISYTGEKDPGEEFFSKNKKGFDFNSFNITYSGKSRFKKIIIGDYNIEYGQGLTAWTGLSFGSGASITGIYKNGRGIVPYSGTDENRFLRGISVSTQTARIKNEAWISYHGIDANKVRDSISNTTYITSFQTSGYHRSYSENLDFHSEHELAFGTSSMYILDKLRVGIVLSALNYSLPLIKTGQPYKFFDFNGKSDYTGSIFYSTNFKNVFVFGEYAMNINHSYAFLNGALLNLHSRASLGVLFRSYSKIFPALKSNAFGANTRNSNENGCYLGMNFKISRTLMYSGYVDIYSFPFIKYRIDQPSQGFDFFHQVDITPTKKFTAQLRYRKRLKQQNETAINSPLNNLTDYFFHSIRLSVRFKIDNTWEYACRTEISIQYLNNKKSSSGSMLSQDLLFHPMGKPFSLGFRYAMFNCTDFDSRIYEYENDVQGAFSLPFYYGIGSRFYTNVTYKLGRNLTVSFRYACTLKDQTKETSGNSDFKLQFKYTFI